MRTRLVSISVLSGIGLAVLILLLLAPAPARAATYTVTTTGASGSGSLLEAILNANTNPGPDTIDFSVSGTIVLTGDLPLIVDELTISGPGADQLVVSGARAFRPFAVTYGQGVTSPG